jgi:hypothetical protein
MSNPWVSTSMTVAVNIPGVLKVALTMVKILNCDNFHFPSLFFSFATAGNTVVTLAIVSVICCVIGVYWL